MEWIIRDKIAFRDQSAGNEEIYLLAKRKSEKYRVRVGVFQINLGVLGSYSLKDIGIGLGFRKLGVVGISKEDNNKIRVKCPHCGTIQELKKEWQLCLNCERGFYLYDDTW